MSVSVRAAEGSKEMINDILFNLFLSPDRRFQHWTTQMKSFFN